MVTNDLAHSTARRGWKARLMTQTSRRWLVLGLICTCTVLVLMGLAQAKTPLSFVVVGLLVAEDILLLYVTRRVAELPERQVDERQEAIRNRAYRLAYRIVTHAIIWPAVLVVILATAGDPHGWLAAAAKNTAFVIAAITSGLQLLAFLPTMMLAWTEPDLVEGE